MSLTDTPIGFAVTDATSQAPLIYVGQTTALSLAIVNNSGADIALSDGGAQASAFGFYPPQGFFTPDELGGFALALPGWSGVPDKPVGAFNIGCSQAGTWKSGATLTFTVTNVTSAGPAATGTATVVPANLGDDMPFSLTAPLAVATAPKKGNLSLPDVLDVGLDSQGTVYRSVSTDPLTNKLFLTIKNTGATALSTETDKQPGNPQVFVSFVYGNTSGALAPDDYDPKKVPPVGSAWNIGIDSQSLQAPWGGTKPQWSANLPHPTWTLAPDPTNHFILGPAQQRCRERHVRVHRHRLADAGRPHADARPLHGLPQGRRDEVRRPPVRARHRQARRAADARTALVRGDESADRRHRPGTRR